MRLTLGKFACSSLEEHFGSEPAAGAEAATRHYSRRLKSSRPPLAVPEFGRQPATGAAIELALELEPELEAALEEEARRQGVDLGLLLSHAVFVFLADLDADRQDRTACAKEEAGPRRYQRGCTLVTRGTSAVAPWQAGSA